MSVAARISRIEKRGMWAGEPLSGELAGCNKIKHRKTGLRIVFRQVGESIEIIEIVAIGKREGSRVYRDAAARIREEDQRTPNAICGARGIRMVEAPHCMVSIRSPREVTEI